MLRRLYLLQFFLFTSLFLSPLTQAESSKVFGKYEVHYSVLNTTFLSPQVAAAYGVVRGKDKALINVAIRENLPGGKDKAKRAIVSGNSFDLIHRKELAFEEIVEQDSVYYIAELGFRDKELLAFTIKIQPDPNISPYILKFSKTLYHDE